MIADETGGKGHQILKLTAELEQIVYERRVGCLVPPSTYQVLGLCTLSTAPWRHLVPTVEQRRRTSIH